MSARLIIGDVGEVLPSLPSGSVDLVVTSPPFLALRSYLPADHPQKHREVGAEPTPATYIDTLLGLTGELRRVLAPHGSICIELGDTYSGSGGAGGDYAEGGLRDGQLRFSGSAAKRAANGIGDDYRPSRAGRDEGWPLAKSMCGIPHLFWLSLAYGRNLLTGQESPAGRWRVRNVVCWARPNPPVGALGDKFRPATSFMTVACLAGDRYFDLDAVRTPLSEPGRQLRKAKDAGREDGWGRAAETIEQNPAGSPPLDWWEPLPEEEQLWDQWADELWRIPTQPYAGAHYAVYPPALITRPIKAMCPQRVCTACGLPSRRIVESEQRPSRPTNGAAAGREHMHLENPSRELRHVLSESWSDCGHGSWRNGVVLDPFAGSGTTLQVATGHGRDAIGIELDERNADLVRDRCGMFLSVEEFSPEGLRS